MLYPWADRRITNSHNNIIHQEKLYQRLLQNHSACLLYCTNLLLRLQTCRWLVQGHSFVFLFFQKYLFFLPNKTDKNASLRFYVSVFSVCLQRDKYPVNDHEHQRLLN